MYEQMKKNNVDSSNQLEKNKYIKFYNLDKKGIKVMFAGNSITLHGVKEDIGWNHEHGMAASSEENDYVHILMREISKNQDASFCVCQVSRWECNYKNGHELYDMYSSAKDFNADIVIARFIENCPSEDFDIKLFKKQYDDFIAYLSNSYSAKVILTDGFWRHPGDYAIREVADTRNCPFVELGDLGERDDMKAVGLFWHDGVANHPGDKGMLAIAERIYEALGL